MKDIAGVVGTIIVAGLVIWGSYWVVKKVSYELFYEDMVQQTVIEMVQPEVLR